MNVRILSGIFLLTVFHQGLSFKTILSQTPIGLSSIVLLKCDLENGNMTDFFIKLALNETKCPIQNCSSSISDIIQAAELNKFNSSILALNTKLLNVTDVDFNNTLKNYNMTVNSTLFYLNIFETTFSEIYENFVTRIEEPKTAIPNILKILNVDSYRFFTEYSFGTDLTRLQILATGNYSLNNLKLAIKNVSLSVSDLISCLPLVKIVKNIGKVNSTELYGFVRSLNITSKEIKSYFSGLNVSSSNFLNYTTFAQIRGNLSNYLNQDGALGIFTSKNQVVTSKKAVPLQKQNIEFVLNYTKFYLQSQKPTIQYIVSNVSAGSQTFAEDVAVIRSQTSLVGEPSKIGWIYNATTLANCTYVTKLSNDTLITVNTHIASISKNYFRVTKSNNTIYNLGSPIYCHNQMYGLAIKNDTQYIDFVKFKTSNVTVQPIIPETPVKPSSNSGTFLSYNFIILLFGVIAKFFN